MGGGDASAGTARPAWQVPGTVQCSVCPAAAVCGVLGSLEKMAAFLTAFSGRIAAVSGGVV